MSAWQLHGEVNGDLLQEGLGHRLCDPGLLHPEPMPMQHGLRVSSGDTQILKGRSGSVSVGSLVPGVHKPSEGPWRVWSLILNVISPLLPSFWGFFFAPRCRVSFFHRIQCSPVNGCSAASCNSGVLTGEDEHTSSYFTVSIWKRKTALVLSVGH